MSGNRDHNLKRAYVSLGVLKKLRRAAQLSAAVDVDGPQGWAKSEKNIGDIVRVFRTLRIKDAYQLHAYQFRAGDNGNGVVYALPTGHFPEPGDCELDNTYALAPPLPAQALPSVLDAIDGDGTSWSYMAASLLMRELQEFGAIWHGCSWGTHEIIGQSASRTFATWDWRESAPICFKPVVVQNKGNITSTFYTFSGCGTQRIVRHIDTFNIRSYNPSVSEETIAEGPHGYIH